MTNQERHIITSVWNDMTLRIKLDDNPYSLSQDELMALQNNDRLISTMDYLLKDALIKKAMVQVRNWQVLASNQPTQATAL
tara:strand:- start:82 stop:324 length:243 start_codon:yes stop_codon:yes gene_type:complete